MLIEGKKNLEFVKRACLSHLTYCALKSVQGTDKEMTEKWDPEIAETNQMLDAVEKNLERYREDIPQSPFAGNIYETAGFFR
jgi:hypothetical protein